jgi:outer membrane protein
MFKSSLTKSAVLLASVLMAGAVSAKEMKVGFVDVQAIVAQLPQTAKVQESLKTEFSGKIADVQKLEKDLSFNIEKFKRDGSTMSAQQKKDLEAEITKQQQQYEPMARALDEAYRARQNEERNKLMALIKTAIDAVAAKEQYDVIYNAGAAVYAKPEYDISSAVVSQVSKAK